MEKKFMLIVLLLNTCVIVTALLKQSLLFICLHVLNFFKFPYSLGCNLINETYGFNTMDWNNCGHLNRKLDATTGC